MSGFVTDHTSQGLWSQAPAPIIPAIVLTAPEPLLSTATASSSLKPLLTASCGGLSPSRQRPGSNVSDSSPAACLTVVHLSMAPSPFLADLCPSQPLSVLLLGILPKPTHLTLQHSGPSSVSQRMRFLGIPRARPVASPGGACCSGCCWGGVAVRQHQQVLGAAEPALI